MAQDHGDYLLHRLEAPGLQMAIILMGVFMAILDSTVVQVAIPTMEAELGANTDQIQWVLTGYLLVLGIMVPLSGWLTDRFGAKRVFIFALLTFTAGSALCGLAWSLPALILFRVLQGIGGGLMMPVAQAMIFSIFPPQRRGVAMGLFGIVIMAAPAFGPLISGWLVEYATWRLIFYINVPIGVIAAALGVVRLYPFPHQGRLRLDVPGFALSVTGFFALLYGFSNVAEYGWTNWRVEPFIIAGSVLIAALVGVELRQPQPLIQIRVLKNYMFAMSQLISSLVYVALYIGLFLMPLFLQNTLGYTALQTGTFLTPAALISAVVMVLGGRLFDRLGARPLGIVGIAILIGATYAFTQLNTNSSAAFIQTLYIARSVGMSLTMMPVTTAGMNTVPPPLLGQASAVSNTIRQVAASLGTAVLTNYVTQQQTIHFQHLADQMTAGSPQALQLTGLAAQLVHQGVPPAAASTTAALLMDQTLQTKAFVAALDDTFWISTLLATAAFVAIWFFASAHEHAVRQGRAPGRPAGPAPVEV